jgi:hypothetical protein
MVVEALLIAIYLHRKTTSIYLCNLPSPRLSRPAGACPAEPSAVSIHLDQLLPCVAELVTSQQSHRSAAGGPRPQTSTRRMEAYSCLRSHMGISSRMVLESSTVGVTAHLPLPPLGHLFLERNVNGSSTTSMAIVTPKAYAHTAIESTNCSLS